MTNEEKMTKRCTSSASSNCPLHSLNCHWHIIVLSHGVNTFVRQTEKCCITIRFVEHSLFCICCMAHCFSLHRGIKIPHHHHSTMNIDPNATALLCAAAGTAPAARLLRLQLHRLCLFSRPVLLDRSVRSTSAMPTWQSLPTLALTVRRNSTPPSCAERHGRLLNTLLRRGEVRFAHKPNYIIVI